MRETIRVAMMGTAHPHAPGKMQMLRNLPAFEVAGAAESDPKVRAAREKQKEFAGIRWGSAEEFLDAPKIMGIVVEGRVRQNVPAARAAVAAGKHVHLEKPAGTDLAGCRDLLDEAQGRGLRVQMGYMLRYNRGFQLAFRAVREGWLGRVFAIHAEISTNAQPPEARAEQAQYAGGMMFELGCHLIDPLVALLGRPERVAPMLSHDGAQKDGLADNTVAAFRFPGANGTLVSSALESQAFPRRRFEVLGPDGAVVIQPLEPPAVRLCLRRPVAGFAAGWQEVPIENTPRYRDDFIEWAACIRGEREPTFGPAHDLLVQETVLRACGVLAD